ncbi:43e3b787-56cf-4473-a52b-72a5c0e7763d [Thermothielavioides terrestris]|uniref:43e3b787-56cf-4473-a52b-72a5c0e7763d n=1 Tax=Thermothielavioides terrestris TaxID=2587410 RepID=A0A3S4CAJ5_9PEZI|nr:43e3b787-56cf-4473-a52b-72a5c0e7763d [Thermothielavioides terrestris]
MGPTRRPHRRPNASASASDPDRPALTLEQQREAGLVALAAQAGLGLAGLGALGAEEVGLGAGLVALDAQPPLDLPRRVQLVARRAELQARLVALQRRLPQLGLQRGEHAVQVFCVGGGLLRSGSPRVWVAGAGAEVGAAAAVVVVFQVRPIVLMLRWGGGACCGVGGAWGKLVGAERARWPWRAWSKSGSRGSVGESWYGDWWCCWSCGAGFSAWTAAGKCVSVAEVTWKSSGDDPAANWFWPRYVVKSGPS